VDIQWVVVGVEVRPACTNCFLDELEAIGGQFGEAEDANDMDSMLAEAVGDDDPIEEEPGDLGYSG
jgi:hypothetical protein